MLGEMPVFTGSIPDFFVSWTASAACLYVSLRELYGVAEHKTVPTSLVGCVDSLSEGYYPYISLLTPNLSRSR